MCLPIVTWLTGFLSRALSRPAVHPWRDPCRRVSGDGMRVEPSLMHHEGGSWTAVRTHTPSKLSKGSKNLRLPSPWIAPSFGRTDHSPLRTVLAPFSAHGSPSLVLFERLYLSTDRIRRSSFPASNPRTVPLPLSVSLSSMLPRAYTLADPELLAAPPITGKRWVLRRLRYHTGGLTQQLHQLRQSCISA